MPRKGPAPRRPLVDDPVYGSKVVTQLVNRVLLDGKKTVTINPGTQPNDDIVLEGLGVGHLQRSGRGSMHVHVDVQIPKKLDEKSRELLEELAKVRGEVRVEPHRQQASFFDKLRDTFMG